MRAFFMDQELPSLKQMAAELLTSAKSVIETLASKGIVLTTEEKAIYRYKGHCESCEFFIKDQSRCSRCGCYMKVKVWIESMKCPANKW